MPRVCLVHLGSCERLGLGSRAWKSCNWVGHLHLHHENIGIEARQMHHEACRSRQIAPIRTPVTDGVPAYTDTGCARSHVLLPPHRRRQLVTFVTSGFHTAYEDIALPTGRGTVTERRSRSGRCGNLTWKPGTACLACTSGGTKYFASTKYFTLQVATPDSSERLCDCASTALVGRIVAGQSIGLHRDGIPRFV